jgi:hypothetical protein
MFAAQASAQDRSDDNASEPVNAQAEGLQTVGRTSETGIGEVGRRQTVGETPLPVEPLTRINNRLQTRIESRLDNRIDRNYDPAQRTSSAFDQADRRARQANQSRPR